MVLYGVLYLVRYGCVEWTCTCVSAWVCVVRYIEVCFLLELCTERYGLGLG